MSKKKFLTLFVSIVLIGVAISAGIYAAKFVVNPFASVEGAEMNAVERIDGKVKFNVLIVGLDKAETNTDVIMLASFDEKNNKLAVMSIPRDTYVTFGSRKYLINSAYVMPVTQEDGSTEPGGIELLAEKVTHLTGIPINYYVIFRVGTFEAVIDQLGGVDFDVPCRMKYSDPAQGLYIDLQPGLQHLTGNQAEGMVRFRGYPQADLQRVKVQQDLLKELFRQKLNAGSIGKLPGIYSALKDKIMTNFTLDQMVRYGTKMMKVDYESIYTCTMPTVSAGDAHLYPDQEEIDKLVEEVFKYDGPIPGNSTEASSTPQ